MVAFLNRVSSYVHSVRHAIDQVSNQAHPVGVELRVPPAGGEVAAEVDRILSGDR